jgi:hypothetical protein
MGPPGSPLPDEPEGRAVPRDADPGLVVREPFLRRVLADFEAGRLDAYDYTQRVLAINAVTSTAQMQAIVDPPSDGSSVGAAPARPRGLDAVDLARLRSAQQAESRRPTARYLTLAIVFVLFAVLIGIGMYLATHVHGAALPARTAGALRLALMAPGWR